VRQFKKPDLYDDDAIADPPKFVWLLYLYIITLFFSSLIQTANYDISRRPCKDPAKRIDYIFPARPIACWLTEKVKKP